MAALRELVVPPREREDQAAFLRSAADYIRQLQARSLPPLFFLRALQAVLLPCNMPLCMHVSRRGPDAPGSRTVVRGPGVIVFRVTH